MSVSTDPRSSESPNYNKVDSAEQRLQTAQLPGVGCIPPAVCLGFCWDCNTSVDKESVFMRMDRAVWMQHCLHWRRSWVTVPVHACLPTGPRHFCPGHGSQWSRNRSRLLRVELNIDVNRSLGGGGGYYVWRTTQLCVIRLLLPDRTSFPGLHRPCSTLVDSRLQKAIGASGSVARAAPRICTEH